MTPKSESTKAAPPLGRRAQTGRLSVERLHSIHSPRLTAMSNWTMSSSPVSQLAFKLSASRAKKRRRRGARTSPQLPTESVCSPYARLDVPGRLRSWPATEMTAPLVSLIGGPPGDAPVGSRIVTRKVERSDHAPE